MKEELRLDHFEGRSWSGLHHHAVLTMVAYGFLQYLRLKEAAASPPRSADKTPAERGKNRPRKTRTTPALRPSA